MAACLGCDLLAGRRDLPGGFVHQTASWAVNHVIGPMNLGTLVVGPREHVVAVSELDDTAVAELGPVLRDTARVVEALCQPEQTHLDRIGDKTGARNRAELTRYAMQAGIEPAVPSP